MMTIKRLTIDALSNARICSTSVKWFITHEPPDTRIIDPLPAPTTEVKPGVENASLNRAVSKKSATPVERLSAPEA
jgi:hypothetical protein